MEGKGRNGGEERGRDTPLKLVGNDSRHFHVTILQLFTHMCLCYVQYNFLLAKVP